MIIFKKILVKLFTLVVILSLFACGVNSKKLNSLHRSVKETAAASGASNNYAMKAMAVPMADEVVMEVEEAAMDNGTMNLTTDKNIEADKNGRKLIKNISINTETKEFDKTMEFIDLVVKEFNGFVDNSYVDSGSINAKDYRRNANYSIRVPVDMLDQFYKKISENLNVVFKQESVRDVTDSYDDTEAKIKSLKLEVNKLNELLTKATTVEDLIKVEDKLTSVRHELERYENKKKNLDKQINYSTINLSISEVKELSEVNENDDISKETLIKKLKKNLEDTKKFIINIGCYIFTHIPAILVIILCIAILLFILALIFKPKKTKNDINNKFNKNIKNSHRINGHKKEEDVKELADRML